MKRGRKARAFSYEKAGARSPGLEFLRRLYAPSPAEYSVDGLDEEFTVLIGAARQSA